MAYKVDRPKDVQREIDKLGRCLMELQTRYPISGFRVRPLHPQPRVQAAYRCSSDKYWELIHKIHRDHHRVCEHAARNGEDPVDCSALDAANANDPLWLWMQESLPAFSSDGFVLQNSIQRAILTLKAFLAERRRRGDREAVDKVSVVLALLGVVPDGVRATNDRPPRDDEHRPH